MKRRKKDYPCIRELWGQFHTAKHKQARPNRYWRSSLRRARSCRPRPRTPCGDRTAQCARPPPCNPTRTRSCHKSTTPRSSDCEARISPS